MTKESDSGSIPAGIRPAWRRDTVKAVRSVVSAFVLAALFILILVPVTYVFYGSVRSGAPGVPDAVFTWANWETAYASPSYLTALGNTVVLGIVVAILSLAVGGALAWIVARTDALWRNQLALLVIVPLMISNLITTLAWIALLAPNAGFINAWGRAHLGIRTLFNIYSFSGIVLVHVLHYASFAFISLFAALRSIDSSLEEASYMLGAGPLRTGLRMTLPLIMPTLSTTFLVIFVFVAENFSVPTLLGTPVGFQTLPSLIYYNMAVSPAQPNVAAASGTMLLWVALLGTIFQRQLTGPANRYVTIGGKGGRHRLVRLGPWRYVATAFVVLFVFMAVALPYAVLVLASFLNFLTPNLKPELFTLDNYRALFVGDNLTAVSNSLLFSALGGLGMTVLYIGIGFILSKSRHTWGRIVDYVTIIPTAIPALILGIGLIWTFVGLPIPVYGTAAILMIAYFLRFIGFGVRHANNALSQVAGDLTEAARIGGASPARAFWDVLVPIIRPSILSLWTVLFIFIFMEISATILLYTSATRTLSTVLWNYMGSGSQTRAFAVAVAQATLIFALLIVTDRKFGTLRSTLQS
jgi:iron(III) transport system permease protein